MRAPNTGPILSGFAGNRQFYGPSSHDTLLNTLYVCIIFKRLLLTYRAQGIFSNLHCLHNYLQQTENCTLQGLDTVVFQHKRAFNVNTTVSFQLTFATLTVRSKHHSVKYHLLWYKIKYNKKYMYVSITSINFHAVLMVCIFCLYSVVSLCLPVL